MPRPPNDAVTEKVARVLSEKRWACISEVTDELNIYWGTATKHLEDLVEEGKAVGYSKANIRLFGLADAPPSAQEEAES